MAGLALLPHLEFYRDTHFVGFKSAYDEDTFLLGDVVSVYRLVSEVLVRALGLLSPSPGGVLVAADVVIAVAAALAAWALAGACIRDPILRLLAALGLLVLGDLLSLANVIVWTDWGLADLRRLDPPTTLELIPDATTSFFSVFRTPEPGVSWIALFGFLALAGGRDPLAAFDGPRRRLTLALCACLGFIYPFASVAIVALIAALLAWAMAMDRRRSRSVAVALAVATASFVLATVISALSGASSGTVALFSSHMPSVSPSAVVGLAIAVGMLVAWRKRVIRDAAFFLPVVAALLPLVLINQQLVTGVMVSNRDWERSSNYVLVGFALVAALGALEGRVRPGSALRVLRGASIVCLALLAVKLVDWQRDVYAVWTPTNVQARETAQLLADHACEEPAPVVVGVAQNVPLVRLLTEDRFDFTLDYTQLFARKLAAFDDAPDPATARFHRERLFEYFFRLGFGVDEVRDALEQELETNSGFLIHFLFAFEDVWPPATDWRSLGLDGVRGRLEGVVAGYGEFIARSQQEPLPPAWIITDAPLAAESDGRRNRLVAESAGLRLYWQEFGAQPSRNAA